MSTPSATKPRISVIIPVYRTPPFVAQALDSVRRQTYSDYEIIVVNDGSPDSKLLEEILEPYRDRITYIVQENRGGGGARNRVRKGNPGKRYAVRIRRNELMQRARRNVAATAKLIDELAYSSEYIDYQNIDLALHTIQPGSVLIHVVRNDPCIVFLLLWSAPK
jgi:glycosyltransferase involved in cell wall biosynthesis